MEDRNNSQQSDYTGGCDCRPWYIDHLPGPGESVRRLIKALEEELENTQPSPTDAIKKFGDDLKDADKEYQGIVEIVTKFEKFYDDLECKMATARGLRDEITGWCRDKVDEGTRLAIEALGRDTYEAEERRRCCQWIYDRAKLIELLDCVGQSEKKVEEATDDYNAIKGLEDTLTKRFAELKELRDRAEKLFKDGKFKSVCAVCLEFEEVFNNLSLIKTWAYAYNECNQEPYDRPDSDPKKAWPPEVFKKRLASALREVVLAKYQRFRWSQQFIERTNNNTKSKDACEKFRKSSRDDFILEAQDQEASQASK